MRTQILRLIPKISFCTVLGSVFSCLFSRIPWGFLRSGRFGKCCIFLTRGGEEGIQAKGDFGDFNASIFMVAFLIDWRIIELSCHKLNNHHECCPIQGILLSENTVTAHWGTIIERSFASVSLVPFLVRRGKQKS